VKKPEIDSMLPETFNTIVSGLEGNLLTFRGLLESPPGELIYWRPGEKKWNLLEIVCHLIDEEVEDFRMRVRTTLLHPGEEPPGIDPEGWVVSRHYADRDYHEMVSLLLEEREDSIQWLRSLGDAHWDNSFQHRIYGPMKASMFLANWLTHDYLHIRQILRLKYLYLMHATGEDLRYAGEW
jgi:hypothetical protein